MTSTLRYQPGPTAAVDLGDNTNLWGTPPAARAALMARGAGPASSYPSPYGARLQAAAGDYLGVSPDQVVTGCGSDDVLDAAIRSAAEPGQHLAFCGPTFSMIPALARINRLLPVAVPFRPDWDIDPDRLLAAGAAVTYICAPNNPTATGASRAAIEAVLEGAQGLVIVDEAYAEYAGTTVVNLLPRSDRLLVVRTLSKAFGLAGLRIGYAAGAPDLVRRIEGARGPFKVTSVSEAAAVAALTEGRDWVAERVQETLALRRRFEAAVAAIPGWELLPSQANFVLARPAPGTVDTAAALEARLRAIGVAGRFFPALPSIGDAIRFTIGPWEMLAPVLEAMAQGDRS
jgi:histidinol-phosphate aminotransferase